MKRLVFLALLGVGLSSAQSLNFQDGVANHNSAALRSDVGADHQLETHDTLWDHADSPMSHLLAADFWEDNEGKEGRLQHMLRQAVEMGVSVDAHNENGWSAITFAAEFNDINAMRILLDDFNANVNNMENDFWTALHFASVRACLYCCVACT